MVRILCLSFCFPWDRSKDSLLGIEKFKSKRRKIFYFTLLKLRTDLFIKKKKKTLLHGVL